MEKAYVLADRNIPPELPDNREWFVLRIALGIVGKTVNNELPEYTTELVVPRFTLVATSREAAKIEIAERIDRLFDVFEQ